jgi:tetratricopeptide (TPR) repeat protein
VWRATSRQHGECAVKVLDAAGGWHAKYLKKCLEVLRDAGKRTDQLPVLAFDVSHRPAYVATAMLPEGSVNFELLSARLPIHESWMLLEDLARSLAWLHVHGVVHTGLNSWNAFVTAGENDEPQVLLGDVGQGWVEGDPPGKLHRQAPFIAPEYWDDAQALVVKGKGQGRDVYAFGVLAWHLLNDGWPRGGMVYDPLLEALDEEVDLGEKEFAGWLRGTALQPWPSPPDNEGVAQRQRIVERCLAVDPSGRFDSMEKVYDALRMCLGVDGLPRKAPPPAVSPEEFAAMHRAEKDRPKKRRLWGFGDRTAEPEEESDAEAVATVEPMAPIAASEVLPSVEPVAPVAVTAPKQPQAPDGPEAPVVPAGTVREAAGVVGKAVETPTEIPPESDDSLDLSQLPVSGKQEPVRAEASRETTGSPYVPAPALAASGPVEDFRRPGRPGRRQEPDSPDDRPVAASTLKIPEDAPVPSLRPAGMIVKERAPVFAGAGGKLKQLAAAAMTTHGGWPAVAGLALLGSLGAAGYAVSQVAARRAAERERAALVAEVSGLRQAAPQANSGETAKLRENESATRLGAAGRAKVTALVETILASRPSDAWAMDVWRSAVRPVAMEALKEFKEAAATPSDCKGSLQLARLHSALGNEAEALPLLEKVSRDLEQSLLSASGTAKSELIPVQAVAEALTGSILMDQRRIADALPHLQLSSTAYESWLATAPTDETIAPQYARNLLLEGRALAARGQGEEAATCYLKIPSLTGSPGDADFSLEERFLLADGKFEMARLEKEESAAVDHHKQSLDLLLAHDKVEPKSVPCRFRMARGYYELGRLLARSSNPMDATVAYRESVNLYTELMRDHPQDASFKLNLASTYNEVASLIHANKPGREGAREALEYQNFSIVFLRKLKDERPEDNGIRLTLVQSLVLNGELQEAGGDDKTAAERVSEAVLMTDELLAEPMLSAEDRASCQRFAARAWVVTGLLHEKAKKKTEAVEAYSKALKAWEEAAPESPLDKSSAGTAKTRLGKLKPEE